MLHKRVWPGLDLFRIQAVVDSCEQENGASVFLTTERLSGSEE